MLDTGMPVMGRQSVGVDEVDVISFDWLLRTLRSHCLDRRYLDGKTQLSGVIIGHIIATTTITITPGYSNATRAQ
jgi:hypothetical protein